MKCYISKQEVCWWFNDDLSTAEDISASDEMWGCLYKLLSIQCTSMWFHHNETSCRKARCYFSEGKIWV